MDVKAAKTVLSSGKTLLDWLHTMEENGLVELWDEGRIGPVTAPIDCIEELTSVRGFQEVIRLVVDGLSQPAKEIAAGMEDYFGPRAAATAVPSHKFMDVFNVSLLVSKS